MVNKLKIDNKRICKLDIKIIGLLSKFKTAQIFLIANLQQQIG